jgi:hypothetical protein
MRTAVIAFALFSLAGCQKIKSLWSHGESKIDPCDSVSNYYEGDRHFVERDFVTQDRNLDYRKLFEADKIQNSPCDPVHGRIQKTEH